MKRQSKVLLIIAALPVIAFSSGCANTSQGSKTYTRSQAQQAMTSYSGTVLRVADVKIQTETSGAVGAVAGAVMGGMVGSTIGGGGGKRVATTAGALGGAAAGSAAEQKLKTKAGVELEVELDDGRLMVIVQEKDDQYRVGDRIRVIQATDGTLRVRQ